MNIIDTSVVATLLGLISVSAYFYKHKDKKYTEGKDKKISSPKHFEFVYRYLQLSTIITIILSRVVHIDWGTVFRTNYSGISGIVIAIIGIAVFVAAKVRLGANYSPCFDSYVPQDIVRDGIYRHIRHPIYTANIIFLIGVFIATGHILAAVNIVLLTYYYWRSAQKEEAALAREFATYRSYQKHSSMFFPTHRVRFWRY